ncbi:hypothetical protein [Deminuibacter soli]|uniref:Uncharacterized protein n=1 Tax=Deminuibacter soli TaxID=2291815 RepID=A0A3E1NQJ3_9BACT|nr:hypothetical protein [Deminuibacter soli]RFM30196.1 hypothetical protein DXN05_04285 [Deminuibacter soli]
MRQWNTIVLLLLAAAAVLLLWKEWRRVPQKRRWLRLWCTVLALAGFGGLAIPVHYTVNKTAMGKALLLTDGYDEDSLQALLKANNGVKIYKWNKGEVVPANIQIIHLLGYGLLPDELQQLPPAQCVFHPATPVAGIGAVSWLPQLTEGNRLQVQGAVTGNANQPLQLLLQMGSTLLDSLTLAPGIRQFTLGTVPRHLGNAVYTLTLLQAKDTLEQQPVAVTVQQAPRLKVLLLASSPDFENKFLAGWLGRNGHTVFIRTAISKEKYHTSFLNTPAVSLDRLNNILLDSIDVCIADAAALQAMPASEITTLQAQVTAKGMGMIIRSDTAYNKTAFYQQPFIVQPSTEVTPQELLLRDENNAVTAALTTTQQSYLQASEWMQPLVQNNQRKSLAAAALLGSGKLVYTTLNNSYSWLLAAHEADYAAYWTGLLQQAARKRETAEQWQVLPALPLVRHAVRLVINAAVPPQIQVGAAAIALAQNPQLPYLYEGSYWPAAAGWQAGIGTHGDTHWWYAYALQDWLNVQRQQRLIATRDFCRLQQNAAVTATQQQPEQQELSPWYAAVVLLLACTVLWIERKLAYT